MASLGILAAGCAAYVATDKQFMVEGIGGYWQVFCWCSTTVAAMIVGKHISESMSLTLSSQVFYSNALSILPILLLTIAQGELSRLEKGG
eukprot:CAMPEP_0172157568 /NCGR_PEP_ID=MMETSP1050-20130122/3861_1 /TAXON_ID=233186 /ORGANISM="Cryptomonas curvata, Strain CCAP979/52" /LENGTH=89 /DNA_ID=CAMNT_0012826807 /DNA_START=393 /DNA_END=658 /DNA_ORIENTATION=-